MEVVPVDSILFCIPLALRGPLGSIPLRKALATIGPGITGQPSGPSLDSLVVIIYNCIYTVHTAVSGGY